jgi:hypothetical protein
VANPAWGSFTLPGRKKGAAALAVRIPEPNIGRV